MIVWSVAPAQSGQQCSTAPCSPLGNDVVSSLYMRMVRNVHIATQMLGLATGIQRL